MNTEVRLSDRTDRVYIAHPLRGPRHGDASHILRNMNAVDAICARIVETEPTVLPLSPINLFSFLSPHGNQDTAFDLCRALLMTCDELRVFGDWESSEGCQMEVELARRLHMRVVFEGGEIEGGSDDEGE